MTFLEIGRRVGCLPAKNALVGSPRECLNKHVVESVWVAEQCRQLALYEALEVPSLQSALQILIQFFEYEAEDIHVAFVSHVRLSEE